jgi:thiamine transporter ThiT
MNWKLIFALSLFGVVMALATTMGYIHELEMLLWLLIFILYAIIIVNNTTEKYFLHGLLISILNGVWIAVIHVLLFHTYKTHNPEVMANYKKMPHFAGSRAMILIYGPIIGAITGLVAGLFAFIAGKIMRKKSLPLN